MAKTTNERQERMWKKVVLQRINSKSNHERKLLESLKLWYPVFTELIIKASHKNTIRCNRFQISFVLERVIILQVAKQKTKRRLKVHIHPQIRWLYVQVFLWAKSSGFGLLWLSFKLFFFNSWPCLMSLQADTTNMVISVNTDWVANQRKADIKHFTLNRLQTEGLESISEATLVY